MYFLIQDPRKKNRPFSLFGGGGGPGSGWFNPGQVRGLSFSILYRRISYLAQPSILCIKTLYFWTMGIHEIFENKFSNFFLSKHWNFRILSVKFSKKLHNKKCNAYWKIGLLYALFLYRWFQSTNSPHPFLIKRQCKLQSISFMNSVLSKIGTLESTKLDA